MHLREAGQTGRPIVQHRVVFHRARAQWVTTVVRTDVQVGELFVVVGELIEGKARKIGLFFSEEFAFESVVDFLAGIFQAGKFHVEKADEGIKSPSSCRSQR